jgi:hypothetical protein
MGTHKKATLMWRNKWDRMWEELIKSVVKGIQQEASYLHTY